MHMRSLLLMRKAFSGTVKSTRTIVELKFDKVYVVVVGSNMFRPYIVTRYAPVSRLDRIRHIGIPYDAGHSDFIDCIKAVYDGEMYRMQFFAIDKNGIPVPRVIPCLGYSTIKWEAEKYADKLYRLMQHHTMLHYPADVVKEYRHVGKRNYCDARRGLWTKHFPTWKCILALTALRDAAESIPPQLEFKDDTCTNCEHWECPYAGRPDVTRCEGFEGISD